ncbi:MAG: hypothetical protein FIA98_00890 [Anaerolineae bacterium]|nr:hypothetical protein [Anaerolineae bacterium]
MFRKHLFLVAVTGFFLTFLAACSPSPQASKIISPTSTQTQAPERVATSTVQGTDITVIATPTEAATSVAEIEVPDLCTNASNPCECLGKRNKHDEELGEIKEGYIGSWHAAPMVGSGYNERFVFFPSGNYLFFPSQYECDLNDLACSPSPIEEGIWGIQDNQMHLATGGDIDKLRIISIGKVIDSSPDESPYPFKTTFDGTTYWLMSKDTDMWNPQTGEFCDGF